jgi:hypothetical protein
MGERGEVFAILIPIVLFVSLFTFLAIASLADNRRKQEEARGKYDFLRKLAEGGNFDVQKYMEYEQVDRRAWRERRIENLRLGGLILVGIGLSVAAFFYAVVEENRGVASLGFIPAAVGAALFLGSWLMSRRGDAAAPKG